MGLEGDRFLVEGAEARGRGGRQGGRRSVEEAGVCGIDQHAVTAVPGLVHGCLRGGSVARAGCVPTLALAWQRAGTRARQGDGRAGAWGTARRRATTAGQGWYGTHTCWETAGGRCGVERWRKRWRARGWHGELLKRKRGRRARAEGRRGGEGRSWGREVQTLQRTGRVSRRRANRRLMNATAHATERRVATAAVRKHG